MPERDDKLRQAILGEVQAQVAEEAYGRVTFMGNEGQLAAAILAAVNNVLDQHSTVQYAARCVNPNCDHTDGLAGIFHVREEPGPVTDFIKMADDPHLFELVCRRLWCEAWWAVTS
jgi:hypothetical protein